MKTRTIKVNLCYYCGKPLINRKPDTIFCNTECGYKTDRSYASQCFAFKNPLTKYINIKGDSVV